MKSPNIKKEREEVEQVMKIAKSKYQEMVELQLEIDEAIGKHYLDKATSLPNKSHK